MRTKTPPSLDAWLKEAKCHESAPKIGMYLTHNGVVRESARAKVRCGAEDTLPVTGMFFSYEQEKVDALQYLVGRIKNECVTEKEQH